MEENLNTEMNTEVDESNLDSVVDLSNVNPVAKAIVLGVAGLATGGLVAKKVSKAIKAKKEAKANAEPKKEKEPKGKIKIRSPFYKENPVKNIEEKAE